MLLLSNGGESQIPVRIWNQIEINFLNVGIRELATLDSVGGEKKEEIGNDVSLPASSPPLL